jgi:hypothetical protein
MARLLFALAVLPFMAVPSWAGESLSDAQMDRVTAGASPTTTSTSTSNQLPTIAFTCPSCAAGQVFIPSSPQALFSDLVTFLSAVGYVPAQ